MLDIIDFIIIGAGIIGLIVIITEIISRRLFKRKVYGLNTIKIVGYELIIFFIGGLIIYKTIDKLLALL